MYRAGHRRYPRRGVQRTRPAFLRVGLKAPKLGPYRLLAERAVRELR